MIWVLLPAICALCNVFAGTDVLPRWLRLGAAGALLGLVMASGTPFDWPVFACVALGFILWRIPGWDMMAIHGRIGREKCKPVTWLTRALLDDIPIASVAARKNWGAVWMAIRGLFIAPLFVSLAVLSGNHNVAFLGLGGVLQGVAYRIPGCFAETRWSGMIAEGLTGAAFGLLLAWSA